MKLAYSTETNVYDAVGFDSDVVQKLSGKSSAQVTTLINDYIAKADRRIKNLLKIPITVRAEFHRWQKNITLKLGSYEDEFGFYSANEPENCVEVVYAIYLSRRRLKLPYPKDCDELTEAVSDMTATNCTLTDEIVDFKCGTTSVKAVFLAGGSFYFPQNANLNKNIGPWTYIGFWFKTSDNTSTFTLKLYDKDGNTMTKTFTCNFNDTWEVIGLKLDGFTGNINWNYNTRLQKIEIVSDKACTCYFDNFNFNDSIFWSYPEGILCWADTTTEPYFDLEVTYSYDPYTVTIPQEIEDASAYLAGVKLLDFCIGQRQKVTAFKQRAHDIDTTPDKETMVVTRNRLKREAMEALAGIGFGTIQE